MNEGKTCTQQSWGPIPGEKISEHQCLLIARKDAKLVSNSEEKYCNDNCIPYYVAINTWCFLCDDIVGNERVGLELLDAVIMNGLIPVIAQCQTVADAVIAGGRVEFPPFLCCLSEVNDDKHILQILRFLKRFSPLHGDKLSENALDKFRQVNARCKIYNSQNPIHWLEKLVSDKLDCMLSEFGQLYDPLDLAFSSGINLDAKRLAKKLETYSRDTHYWLDPLYPIGDPTRVDTPYRTPLYPGGCEKYVVEPMAVPKTYKTARIIAPESVCHGVHLQAIRKAAERSLKCSKYGCLFDPQDQDPNRILAFEGAIEGLYATIDLSSASDSIARSLSFRILPQRYLKAVGPHLASHFKIGKNVIRCHMFASSGNPVTFITEGMIFLAIYLVATEFAQLFYDEPLHLPHIFGDDGICDVRAYDTVRSFLEMLGFIVNESKSFSTESQYRESCGVEYLSGYDLTSQYWPRQTLKICPNCKPEVIASLVSLQHRLFRFWKSQRFLTQVVKKVHPTMTSSTPGAECDDLWSTIPQFGRRLAPVDGKVDIKGVWEPTLMVPECPIDISVPAAIKENVLMREAHSALVAVQEDISNRDVDMFAYVTYLKDGPYYGDDPNLELLKISLPRPRIGVFHAPKCEWKKILR